MAKSIIEFGRTAVAVLLFVCGLGFAPLQADPDANPGESLHALFASEWRARMESNPLAATSAGVRGYDDRLPSVAPADIEDWDDQSRAFLAALGEIDREALSEQDQLNYDLFAYLLKDRLALAELREYRIPFVSDSGFFSNLPMTMRQAPLRSREDFDAYLARLEALPAYFDQNIENMRVGIAEGFTAPRIILDGLSGSLRGLQVENAENSTFFAPFRSLPDALSDGDKRELIERAKHLIEGDVADAYRALLTFFEEEYIPAAKDSLGANSWPDGDAVYETYIRHYTTLEGETADSIHALGLSEVARIRAEMDDVIAETGFDGDFAAFLNFLRTDPQFYVTEYEQLLKEAAWIAKQVDGKLPSLFSLLPRQPYGVIKVPDAIAPNYTTGRYRGAPLVGDVGGYYLVNTYAHRERPLYALTALTLHEAAPGHHLQIALSKEIENAPEFRRALGITAYVEGWALYAEKLGLELGLYEDPYTDFGRLTYEMWRACRLVVDTGLHAKGWTREEARAYLAGNTALSIHNVNTEIDRYISWPGQALAYKMGELTILRLRVEAEARLGSDFDIRAFHDAVLRGGALPLPVLEARLEAWIEAEAER